MTSPNGGGAQALLALLRTYGTISKIPEAELAKIGLTRQQAAIIESQLPSSLSNNPSSLALSSGLDRPPVDQNTWGNITSKLLKPLGILSALQAPVGNTKVISGTPTRAGTPISNPDTVNSLSGGLASKLFSSIPQPPSPETAFNKSQDNSPFAEQLPEKVNVNPFGLAESLLNIKGIGDNAIADKQQQDRAQIINQITNDLLNGNNLPSPPQPPQFQLNDFTDKANQMSSKAFSPQYRAIDNAENRALGNYNASNAIVSGLYDQAADALSKAQDDTAQRYQDAIAQSQARNAEDQASKDARFANTQQLLLNSGGDVKDSPDIVKALVQPSADDQAWAEAMSKQNAQAHQNYLQDSGLATQDQLQGTANAIGQQGRVDQQQVLSNYNNRLNDLSDRRLDTKSQEQLQAQQLANQLQQSDFGLQQANYGQTQDLFRNQMSLAGLQNTQQQQGLALLQQQQQAQQAQIDQAYQRQMDQAKLELQRGELSQKEYANRIAMVNAKAAQAKAEAQSQPQYDGPINDIRQAVQQSLPQASNEDISSVQNFVLAAIQKKGNFQDPGSLHDVIEELQNNPAMSPDQRSAAVAAAVSYFATLGSLK